MFSKFMSAPRTRDNKFTPTYVSILVLKSTITMNNILLGVENALDQYFGSLNSLLSIILKIVTNLNLHN